jgi:integrase/recombinase XerC/integrase/recombinase XerD
MTREELSTKELRFSTEIDTSDEVLPFPEPPQELTLDTYLNSLSHEESWESIDEDIQIKAISSADRRRLALEHILKKLSILEIDGKEYVEGYLRHQYRCHFQSSTLRNTYSNLVPFLRFIKGRGKAGIVDVEKGDLEAFIEHEQDRGLKLSTVKLRLATVKAFLRYLIDEGVLREDVFPWKLNIKMPETLPRAMDPDDVERLLEVKGSVRDRAMVLVLLRTGMRIGELLNTRVSDVHMEEQKVLLYEGAKNQRGRVVYFSEDAREALQAWMNKRDRSMELLFYGYKGNPLSYPAARMMFVKYLDRAELSHKGYTLHRLRHTYATELLNARIPLECLEKLMGHSRLEVTRRYAMLTDKTKEEEYFKAMAIIERRERDEHYECDRVGR